MLIEDFNTYIPVTNFKLGTWFKVRGKICIRCIKNKAIDLCDGTVYGCEIYREWDTDCIPIPKNIVLKPSMYKDVTSGITLLRPRITEFSDIKPGTWVMDLTKFEICIKDTENELWNVQTGVNILCSNNCYMILESGI